MTTPIALETHTGKIWRPDPDSRSFGGFQVMPTGANAMRTSGGAPVRSGEPEPEMNEQGQDRGLWNNGYGMSSTYPQFDNKKIGIGLGLGSLKGTLARLNVDGGRVDQSHQKSLTQLATVISGTGTFIKHGKAMQVWTKPPKDGQQKDGMQIQMGRMSPEGRGEQVKTSTNWISRYEATWADLHFKLKSEATMLKDDNEQAYGVDASILNETRDQDEEPETDIIDALKEIFGMFSHSQPKYSSHGHALMHCSDFLEFFKKFNKYYPEQSPHRNRLVTVFEEERQLQMEKCISHGLARGEAARGADFDTFKIALYTCLCSYNGKDWSPLTAEEMAEKMTNVADKWRYEMKRSSITQYNRPGAAVDAKGRYRPNNVQPKSGAAREKLTRSSYTGRHHHLAR